MDLNMSRTFFSPGVVRFTCTQTCPIHSVWVMSWVQSHSVNLVLTCESHLVSVSIPRRTCHRFLRECIVSWTTCASTDCAMEAFRREPWNYSSASPLCHSAKPRPSFSRTPITASVVMSRLSPGAGLRSQRQWCTLRASSASFMFISARFYTFANDQEAKAAVEELVPNQLMRFRALRFVGIGAVLSPLPVVLKRLV